MRYHLLGIGGVGMSALALVLKGQGHAVTGADRNLDTDNVRFLRGEGIRVFPDDGSGVERGVDELVVSTAIEADNPALARARELGIPVIHRAVALSRSLSGHRLVAVVGTCGKSTVTAMLTHVLASGGFDPLGVNGANVPGWYASVRPGGGEWAVAEVDESDKSLVAFRPYAAVVTNASADHYSKAEMDAVFDAFVKDCPGPVVDGRRGIEPLAAAEFDNLIGEHNLLNGALAVAMAERLGMERAAAEAALKGFRGVARRLQRWGEGVYDDYAHNPEKLRAMWTALAARHPAGLVVIWRPHGYAPLRKLLEELSAMFLEVVRPVDRLLLLPVYDAGGTADRSVNSDALLKRITALGERVELVADHAAAASRALALKRPGVALVVAGARDPHLSELAQRLANGERRESAV